MQAIKDLIPLSEQWIIDALPELPEDGMGWQEVDVVMQSGQIVSNVIFCDGQYMDQMLDQSKIMGISRAKAPTG